MTCEICKKKAKYRFSPDFDIHGLGACAKHKSDMTMAYMLLMSNYKDDKAKEYNKFVKSHKDYRP